MRQNFGGRQTSWAGPLAHFQNKRDLKTTTRYATVGRGGLDDDAVWAVIDKESS